MPKDLFSEDREAEQEAIRQARDKRAELAQTQEELELFRSPGWQYFSSRVEYLIDKDQKLLESCPMEDIPSLRGRIQAHRHLLGVEAQLRRRVAELRASLDAPEDTDD